MIVDLGTGDGRAVLAAARAEPRSLVVGIDAVAASMTESSRRAPDNALFVVAAAEALPPELCGLASRVTVLLPWGSLLRGVLGLDPATARGLASLVRVGGSAEAVVSLTPRDGRGELDEAAIARLAAVHAANGLRLVEAVPLDPPAIRALPSTWARRLGRDRDVWRLRFARQAG